MVFATFSLLELVPLAIILRSLGPAGPGAHPEAAGALPPLRLHHPRPHPERHQRGRLKAVFFLMLFGATGMTGGGFQY